MLSLRRSLLSLGLLVALVPLGAIPACSSSDPAPASSSSGGADAGTSPDGATTGDATTGDGGSNKGEPIAAPEGKWTFVDFPDSACDDGTPTGIGIYPNKANDKLLIFLNGGGACWDYGTCVTFNTSTHGPIGSKQFASASAAFGGSVMDHALADNPFKDYSTVWIPYCTGDVHTGDTVNTYGDGAGKTAQIHHKGHANVLAYLKRLVPTFSKPGKIVVSGSSAGGGGALFNYPTFREAWPGVPMMLVEDSLPLFVGNSITPTLRKAWFDSWKLDAVAGPICPGCKDDLSLFMKAVAEKYPQDRLALLSSQQDRTIRTYFQLQPAAFQTALEQLTTDVLDKQPNWRHFYVTGETHTMLGSPDKFSVGSTTLWPWLGKLANDATPPASADPGN